MFAPNTPVTQVTGVFFHAAEVTMDSVTRVGIDLGKHSFHLQGQAARG